MGKKIIIDPITRMSGFLELDVETKDNVVTNAKTSGLLYRGFEKMLKGRSPFDAIYFTERICGICSTAHSTASTLALEEALNVKVTLNDMYLRDLIHGFEFIQNHIRHIYNFIIPDYVKIPDIRPISPQPYKDYRLPERLNARVSRNYVRSIEFSRLGHQGLATLGGKAPHNHGIFVGGVTVNIDSYKISQVKSIIDQIKGFVNTDMLEDVNTLAEYYPDYFKKGISYSNYMSFGVFDKYTDPELIYVKPGVMIEGKKYYFDKNKITENIRYSWYVRELETTKPGIEIQDDINLSKQNAYTFIKAPRYGGLPMQVGPLARLMLTGEYTNGASCMDRNVARALETKKVLDIMGNIAARVEIKDNNQQVYNIPDSSIGSGLIDTTRGSLAHFVSIENKVIKNYDIITPTGWNLSPMDENGVHGAGEMALINSKIDDIENPIELGRIIRSFDPCVSCATHLIGKSIEPIDIRVI
ncbi:Ni/Fe hydrogenase [Fervidicella metallireducens AeB]|uniref:Ni/Fe hydrogenase n=1 Tax=Fervidicella metallireducens AeB TaxID=1403537 RepID=A0A017RX26_9CLOT|nr:nickel-dependent hydrogenase large subunit [Fervidicella metallireducens]EYE89116.1 Ni/Fe hydrogenase [Fervidicella metallireducens AeB]